ncbi:hypothetical protein OEIGOIKO_03444 [Streptomyces chrestomyceticus JCM 4735]|uniref:Uncharacterized protein n=1 Tax=Streptomyces chrestomyceticus JCM 4735 TaxID=1306181 RepID=A0A7U9KVU2_9ACTN|nr:hypothetical protein [Streptomyces chrestomyceticus]GCD35698.1 hypothetical protein OEIGOIKO_03444 [Streptomyces chrestomyceticus JCM 4735]
MSGIEVNVRDETGWSGRLARLVRQVLAEAAPRLEEITGLATPTVTFRLVTPRVWRKEVVAYVERGVQQAFAGSEVYERERAEAAQKVASWRRKAAWTWPLQEGMTLTDPGGRPQTLIAPRALHHTGLRPDRLALHRFLVHECVHHGQILTSQGAVVPPRLSVRRYACDDRAVPALFEGHAEWAERRYTSETFGGPPAANVLRRSWRYRLHLRIIRAQDRHAQQHTTTAAEPPGAALDPRDDGARFVAAAMAGLGDVARFNKVWHDLSLVPTAEEITQPEAWLRRVGL